MKKRKFFFILQSQAKKSLFKSTTQTLPTAVVSTTVHKQQSQTWRAEPTDCLGQGLMLTVSGFVSNASADIVRRFRIQQTGDFERKVNPDREIGIRNSFVTRKLGFKLDRERK